MISRVSQGPTERSAKLPIMGVYIHPWASATPGLMSAVCFGLHCFATEGLTQSGTRRFNSTQRGAAAALIAVVKYELKNTSRNFAVSFPKLACTVEYTHLHCQSDFLKAHNSETKHDFISVTTGINSLSRVCVSSFQDASQW